MTTHPDEHDEPEAAAMSRASSESPDTGSGLVRIAREHPVLTAIFAVCIVSGAILGAVLLTPDWSLARRLAAGAVSGAGVALLITAPRIIG